MSYDSNKPLILIVDDDLFSAEITQSALMPAFQMHHVESGERAFAFVADKIPDLVLLDISMPGMDGYEVCRALRASASLEETPIIFLSGLIGEAERLAGYEVGADDFLAKPASAAELRYKVELTLKNYAERRRLKSELHQAFSTAMTAMSTAAEVGSVLHFLRTSFSCQDYQSLSHEVINTLAVYGLEGTIQIRGEQGLISLGSNGPCSPLEEAVLEHMFGHGRLFEFSSCLSCSYEHVTVIVKNLDRDDAERRGRMRDNIALLTEGADVRVLSLDRDYKLQQQHQALIRLINNTSHALHEIEQQQHRQRLDSDQLFQDLKDAFNLRMLTMGLTESQEEELSALLHDTAERALALYDEAASTEAYMEYILKQLDDSH